MNEESAREGFVGYVGEEIFGVKWRNWKMLTKAYEDASGLNPKLSYGLPALYNLYKDPEEKHPWVPENAGHFWVRWPMADIMGEHLKSLQTEPPIKPGTPDPYVPENKN